MAFTSTALVQNEGGDLSISSVSLPSLGDHQLLIKVSYVAQNPTDVQSLDSNAFGPGTVLGCDVLGSVIDVGPQCSRFNKGDIVVGLLWGGETKGVGGYSEHTIIDERIAFAARPSLLKKFHFKELVTIPLASATAELALFSSSCLGLEPRSGDKVLIWGGSSSVGNFAVQLAHLRGLQVYTTSSAAHHAALTALGAKQCFDYKSEDVVSLLSSAGIKYAFDCIGSETTSESCSKIVGDGTICTVRPGKQKTERCLKETRVTDVLVWTAFDKDHSFGPYKWPASAEDHQIGKQLFSEVPDLLSSGQLKPNRVRDLDGLSSVRSGFQMYRDGAYSNEKIVYSLL